MKKILTTLLILVIYLSLKEETTKTVFSDNIDNDVYRMYHIEMDNLNSHNFNDYFSSMDVIVIEPSINPIYKNKIDIVYFYKNIDDFKEYYIKRLKEKGYYIEANKYLLNPININKIIAFTSINSIYDNISKLNSNYIITKSDGYVKISK